MKVVFEPAARDELSDIFEWIAKDNPNAARRLMARIEDKITRLATPNLAYMGRPGMVEGTRELIQYPYIIVYRVDEEQRAIVIISIVHGARDREHKAT
ncbi:MAG TPA: type II toxin-antitoxin system RelE/ParE family toxin [Xanthobacteraceae bacterium]|nr:type II toxin-antitoxin system RelE/ParE family toxin [Xanthobacteraceae bacterium]